MSNNEELIKKSRLFKNLTTDEFLIMMDLGQPIREIYESGEIVFFGGVPLDSFFIVLSGQLKGEKYHYNGEIDLIEIYTSGDSPGLDIVCTPTKISPLEVTCMREADLLSFKYDTLMNMMPTVIHAKVQENITQMLANENMKKLYKIDMLYRRSLRGRIHIFLDNMSQVHGSDHFHINMDREQFAQYLGVNRSSLSHELSLMRQEGLIDFRKDYFKLKR